MTDRPRFKSQYQVRVADGLHTVLLWETGYAILEGRLIALLAPWLDGSRSIDDIAGVTGELTALDVQFGIEQLADLGYLDESTGEAPAAAAFRELLGVAPAAFAERLASAHVMVTAIGDVSAAAMLSALRALGVAVHDTGTLQVVLTDDYLRPELELVNDEALRSGHPWLLAKPVGAVPSVGPLFTPGNGPCWRCLAARLMENPEMRVLRDAGSPGPWRPYSVATLPATLEAVTQLAAAEVFKYLMTGEAQHLAGRLVTLDGLTLATASHVVVRRQACPGCDPGATLPMDPIQLASRTPTFSEDGGYRLATPEATFARLEHHISPITGIVNSVGPLYPQAPAPIHVYGAGHNFTLRYGRKSPVTRWLGSRSGGKGMTAVQARTSALCEALERYSGCWRGDEPVRRATLREIEAEAVSPAQCLLFSAAQVRERDVWNEREGDYNWVPRPFDEDRAIDWVAAWSLTHQCFRWLPAAFCYFNYPLPEDHDFCRADSNGNAAGVGLEDAILQGFFEVVERDAVSLWWYNRARRPDIDFESFPNRFFTALRSEYARLDRRLWALDLTSDFGIPVFAAISERNGEPASELLVGFGAHFDASLALARACTEVNQGLAAILSGATVRIAAGRWGGREFLVSAEGVPLRVSSNFPRLATGDLRDDVSVCVELARRRGVEVLVLNQTRHDVGLAVVKVVMPGMRHFWARFAAGRLYSVPVELGWLPEAQPETKLNSAHLII